MADSAQPPTPIGKLIDAVERIREELLHVQRELEKIEIVDKAVSGDDT
jgi:hypothetical protein